MAGETTKTIALDFSKRTPVPTVNVTQYSAELTILKATLTDGGTAYTIPTGAAVYFRQRKSSGTVVREKVTSWTGSTITHKLSAQSLAAAGLSAACFEIAPGTGALHTFPFYLNIAEDPIQSDALIDQLEDTGTVDGLAETFSAYTDIQYNKRALAVTSVAEMDALFVEWWKLNTQLCPNATKSQLLERWFGTVLDDERVHGVKFPLFSTSETAIGTLTDDSTGRVCKPSTASSKGQDDFAFLPQFWCLEVSAEKNADGSHTIYAVEHIDSYSTVRNGTHLCWVLQKNTYYCEYDFGGYRYFKIRCHPYPNYAQWPQGTDKAGKTYAYIANPKYAGGLNSSGVPTCGTNLAPMLFTSHVAAVKLWRTRGAQYSGASGNLLKWQLAMIWLKYGVKGNSGTISGCCSYSFQYTAAVTESGVKRVLLTEEQAANFHSGGAVFVGTADSSSSTPTDRGAASMHALANCRKITSISTVTVSGTTYKAINIDATASFSVTKGSTYISTAPYWSGWNDTVQGFDGSKISPTDGTEPGLIQKTEFMNGAYLIVSDELLKWSQTSSGSYTLDVYKCSNQAKVTTDGTISSDYTKQSGTLTFAADTADGWQYIEDTLALRGVLWPKKVSANAGSGTGVKAAMYVKCAEGAVRASWCCGNLGNCSHAGLPARHSNPTTTSSRWNGGCGSPGLAG